MKRKLLVLLVMPLVLAAAVIAGVKASSAQSSSAAACGPGGSGPGGSGVGGSGVGCGCGYPYLSVPDRLYGVAGTSASDVWAVGLQPSASLIMHWDGCAWSVAYNRPVGYFAGVSAVSPSDAWAVGGTAWFSPLAERWNGRSWTRISTPNPLGGGIFDSVAATSANNAWAVGSVGPGPGIATQTQPLIEHWNGTTWTIVPTPPESTSSLLEGITAISSDNAWAVGFSVSSNGTDEPLILHWDGSTWTPVVTPNLAGDIALQAVAAAAADNVWAVGYTTTCAHGGFKCEGVILHWDGTRWGPQAHSDPPSTYLNDFLGVIALPGDGWVVGTSDYASTLIERRNGTIWS